MASVSRVPAISADAVFEGQQKGSSHTRASGDVVVIFVKFEDPKRGFFRNPDPVKQENNS